MMADEDDPLPEISLCDWIGALANDPACDDKALSAETLREQIRDHRDHARRFLTLHSYSLKEMSRNATFTKYAEDQTELRQRLRQMRRKHGLRQVEVAENIGISQPSYFRLESGRLVIRPAHLEALSKLYGEEIRP